MYKQINLTLSLNIRISDISVLFAKEKNELNYFLNWACNQNKGYKLVSKDKYYNLDNFHNEKFLLPLLDFGLDLLTFGFEVWQLGLSQLDLWKVLKTWFRFTNFWFWGMTIRFITIGPLEVS